MLPDFNRLRVFYHVYLHTSIVEAARKLHLSQPAVSQQLQKLEAELKVPLFTRLHKRLVPTHAGEHLFSIVEPFVVQLTSGVDRIRQPQERPSGLLRMGAPKEFGKEFLPGICAEFRKLYPEVRFRVRFEEAGPLREEVASGELDFSLVDVFEEGGDETLFSIEPFIDEEVVLACSQDYYERAIRQNHHFSHLVQQDFLSDEEDPVILRQWFRHHFQKTPPQLTVVMTILSHAALISGVRLGMGLALFSTHLVWDEIRSGEIVPITTARPDMVNRIALIQLQDKVPSLTEKTFLSFLKKGIQAPKVRRRFELIQ